jgi:hypothetical protein
VTDTPLVCQWCHQPITGNPTWWDERPQCADPIRCDRRRRGQAPAHNAGPTVAECAANDRKWPLEKDGE